MDTQTLTHSWTPALHPSFSIAEQWELGPYRIFRQAGESTYLLVGTQSRDPMGYGDLETLKRAGATAYFQDLSAAFKANVVPAYDDPQEDERDVLVRDCGSLVLFQPLTSTAREWIDENVQEDAQWFGSSLVVEHRFAPYLIEGMVGAGLAFR